MYPISAVSYPAMNNTNTRPAIRFNERHFLAFSIGAIYLWFGALKFFPHLSPAEDLARSTLHYLTFGIISDAISLFLLATWEVLIGVLLIFNIFRKIGLRFALVHLICTFIPLLCFPDLTFQHSPFIFTLVGQYIVKNLVLMAAVILLLRERSG
jgi:uncharacterized membrane protein YkgB